MKWIQMKTHLVIIFFSFFSSFIFRNVCNQNFQTFGVEYSNLRLWLFQIILKLLFIIKKKNICMSFLAHFLVQNFVSNNGRYSILILQLQFQFDEFDLIIIQKRITNNFQISRNIFRSGTFFTQRSKSLHNTL